MGQISRSRQKKLRADIVVVGGGGAGLAAAVTAREAGIKKVLVLESRPSPGGNTRFAGGILAAETPLQRRLGFDVSREAVFKSIMDYAHWRSNAALVRAMVDMSGDTVSWLTEKGVTFEKLIPHYHNQTLMTYHAVGGKRRSGARIIKALLESCQKLNIEILSRTAAQKLTTDSKGAINGVQASSKGKEINIAARCVIIATGGFAGNNRMLRQYLPFYQDEMALIGLPHNGDGIRMAEEAGAATGGLITLESEGPTFTKSKLMEVMVRRPDTLWVNRLGQRFTVEHSLSLNEAANSVWDQPGKMSYTLFDENIKELNFMQGVDPFESLIVGNENWESGAEAALQKQIQAGNIKRAKSLSKIADWISADSTVLKNTVSQYNEFCRQGHDALFAKDCRFLIPLVKPPYYAIPGNIQLLVTHGGIRVNRDLEVLDPSEQSIHGLYAAGDDTSGRMGDTYNIRMSGLSMCFAIGTGRLAGKNAVVHLHSS